MKTMCPLGYHCNGFVATHALGHMMYIYTASCFTYVYNYQANKDVKNVFGRYLKITTGIVGFT